MELAPYDRSSGNLMLIPIPIGIDVRLTPRSGIALALAIHELASNAAKYGALSSPAGRLVVSWQLADGLDGRHLHLVWSESCGPEVRPPTRSGFGTQVIERSPPMSSMPKSPGSFVPKACAARSIFP
jgi:two-component system CheB/CheR fusion protein